MRASLVCLGLPWLVGFLNGTCLLIWVLRAEWRLILRPDRACNPDSRSLRLTQDRELARAQALLAGPASLDQLRKVGLWLNDRSGWELYAGR